MFGFITAEGSFEDADKANDFLSQTHQHYDLRHTIPGEPDKDYPIFSAVPTTSFSCAHKHEGYYADMESRCQAFRICTNTARHSGGFGFLCPNGTLFNQRHFVCDWYRNVRCEESENFYSKNAQNRVGNSYEMMETVRQMIEYPMKTISKALSQKPANIKLNTQKFHTVKTQAVQAPIPTVSTAERETSSASQRQTNSGTTNLRLFGPTTPRLARGEDVKSLLLSNPTQDVYVNSFGELSTDPGTKFNPNTARILAKPEKSGRALNFAESINYGLNDYIVPGNKQQKSVRSNRDEGNLGSNLNILRHEIQAEINPKVSGYHSTSPQKSTTNFNFLSHGFAKTKKDYSKSQHSQTSQKQTSSTTRYLSNDLAIETHKVTSPETPKQNPINTEIPEDIQFTLKSTTKATPPDRVDSFLINSFFDFEPEPIGDEIESDNVEELIFQDAPNENANDSDLIQINFTNFSTTDTAITRATPTTTSTAKPTTTTTTTSPAINESGGLASLVSIKEIFNNLEVIEPVTSHPEEDVKIVNKSYENRVADDLMLSGIKLADNLIDDELVIPIIETTTTSSTTKPQPETTVMQTSTEMIMNVKTIETHVRSHRRFKSSRNSTKTKSSNITTTTTVRPNIRRPQLRRNLLQNIETTTISKTSERPTMVTEKTQRHSHHSHHSRHRARTTTKATSTTPSSPTDELNIHNKNSEHDLNRKLSVRNIESSSATHSNNLSSNKNIKSNVRYGSINNQRKRTTTTTTTKLPDSDNNGQSRQNIIRTRGSHTYHQRAKSAIRTNRTTTTTTIATSTTFKPTTRTTVAASTIKNIVGKNINIIPLNVSVINAIDSATNTSKSSSISSSTTTISNTHSNNTDILNNDSDEKFLPFNELTRAIVDESILQNYRTNQYQQQQPQQQQQQQQHQKQPQQQYYKQSQQTYAALPSFTTLPMKAQNYATKSTATPSVYPQGPSIVIARAEGQRISATSPTLYVQQQQQQQQQQQNTKVATATSYESLNEFLSKKFGQQQTAVKPATNYYGTSSKNVYAAQQQTYQPALKQPQNPYFTQQQRQQHTHFPINVQQAQTKHIVYAQPASQQQQQQQPIYQQNSIYKSAQQQQQQQQLPYYSNQINNNYRQPLQQQQQPSTYRNIKLPTLNDGLIPAVYTPISQRRLDNFNFELETSTLPRMKLFTGVSSYDVPLNSVGRLPNDKTQRLRRIK